MKTLKASEEFVEGKDGIGYVSSYFKEQFKDKKFQEVAGTPKFQKLPRAMNDSETESELKPGICSLGDILAFLKNPPKESKDGYLNLFYFPDCLVDVGWDSAYRYWRVGAWQRGDHRWCEYERVFSQATALDSSETHPYQDTIKILEKEAKQLREQVYNSLFLQRSFRESADKYAKRAEELEKSVKTLKEIKE